MPRCWWKRTRIRIETCREAGSARDAETWLIFFIEESLAPRVCNNRVCTWIEVPLHLLIGCWWCHVWSCSEEWEWSFLLSETKLSKFGIVEGCRQHKLYDWLRRWTLSSVHVYTSDFFWRQSAFLSKWQWFPPEMHQPESVPPSLCCQKKFTGIPVEITVRKESS